MSGPEPVQEVFFDLGGWISGACLPMAEVAYRALRSFGGPDLTKGQARLLLLTWRFRDELTDEDTFAVLDRFPL
jgi:hypothetical protein